MPRFKDGEVERLAGKFVVVMTKLGERLIARAAVHISSNMVVPGGRDIASDSTRVTTRSGRLLRSIMGARGMAWKGPESIREFKAYRAGFRATVGTKVPYAGVHEFGHAPFTVITSQRARRFFWAMFMKTRESKWRAMALAKGTTRKAYSGRPFFAPAKPELEKDIPVLLHEEVRKEFKR